MLFVTVLCVGLECLYDLNKYKRFEEIFSLQRATGYAATSESLLAN
jgi:hypothetical protein